MLEIVVLVFCLALAFGACVLIVLNQFKDEAPTWENYFENNVKFWKRK